MCGTRANSLVSGKMCLIRSAFNLLLYIKLTSLGLNWLVRRDSELVLIQIKLVDGFSLQMLVEKPRSYEGRWTGWSRNSVLKVVPNRNRIVCRFWIRCVLSCYS